MTNANIVQEIASAIQVYIIQGVITSGDIPQILYGLITQSSVDLSVATEVIQLLSASPEEIASFIQLLLESGLISVSNVGLILQLLIDEGALITTIEQVITILKTWGYTISFIPAPTSSIISSMPLILSASSTALSSIRSAESAISSILTSAEVASSIVNSVAASLVSSASSVISTASAQTVVSSELSVINSVASSLSSVESSVSSALSFGVSSALAIQSAAVASLSAFESSFQTVISSAYTSEFVTAIPTATTAIEGFTSTFEIDVTSVFETTFAVSTEFITESGFTSFFATTFQVSTAQESGFTSVFATTFPATTFGETTFTVPLPTPSPPSTTEPIGSPVTVSAGAVSTAAFTASPVSASAFTQAQQEEINKINTAEGAALDSSEVSIAAILEEDIASGVIAASDVANILVGLGLTTGEIIVVYNYLNAAKALGNTAIDLADSSEVYTTASGASYLVEYLTSGLVRISVSVGGSFSSSFVKTITTSSTDIHGITTTTVYTQGYNQVILSPTATTTTELSDGTVAYLTSQGVQIGNVAPGNGCTGAQIIPYSPIYLALNQGVTLPTAACYAGS